MNKTFDFGVYVLTDFFDVVQTAFTRQNNTLKTQVVKKLYPLKIVIVHLCACMKFYRRNIHFQNAGILNNQRVNADVIKVFYKFFGDR